MRIVASFAAALCLTACAPAAPRLGLFNRQDDVGPVPAAGSATYDAKTGVYRVTGGGRDIWAKSDDFHFVSKPESGDLILAATLGWVTDSGDPHRKAGLMMRQSLAADSPYVDIVVHGNHHVALQYRDTPGGETHEIEAILHGPGRMALEREGEYIYMSVAGTDGVLHHAGGGHRMKFAGTYYAGLVVCAHDDKITKTVDFSDVTLSAPSPSSAPIESTIETVDATSAYRAVVYNAAGMLTSPAWTADGRSIAFSNGANRFAVTIPPEGGPATEPSPIAGVAPKSRNYVSPDGKWIAAISPATDDTGDHEITVTPVAGGRATVLADFYGGPGSLGDDPWSADSTHLTFVSYRAESQDKKVSN